jgi:spoIIIJ-associated protein
MKKINMKGKTVEEAVDSALQVLGLAKEAVDIKIIKEGRGAVLGMFGGEEAEVEVGEKLSIEEQARDCLQEILDKMGFMALVNIVGKEEDRTLLEIKGEDLGRIIGKDGATLNALQTIVSAMVSNAVKGRVWLSIDAEGYRQKRKGAIERLAQEAADDVERLGVEKMLPPMSPADRRTVHMLVKTHPKLASFSVGERDGRRVVITLATNAPKETAGRHEKHNEEGEA